MGGTAKPGQKATKVRRASTVSEMSGDVPRLHWQKLGMSGGALHAIAVEDPGRLWGVGGEGLGESWGAPGQS